MTDDEARLEMVEEADKIGSAVLEIADDKMIADDIDTTDDEATSEGVGVGNATMAAIGALDDAAADEEKGCDELRGLPAEDTELGSIELDAIEEIDAIAELEIASDVLTTLLGTAED